MSFFIRKGGGGGNSRNNLTRRETGKKKMGNKDMKMRPQQRPNKQDKFRKRKLDQQQQKNRSNSQLPKKQRFDADEEVESSSDDEVQEEQQKFASREDLETAQEKKLRLAKLYLEEIEREEKERQENEEVDTHLLVTNRLQTDILEQEGRLRREVADKISPDLNNIAVLSCSKWLSKSVTCLCISPDNLWIYSGCKDGNLIKWSIKEKKKVAIVKKKVKLSRKKQKKGVVLKSNSADPNSAHASTITALAISSDGKYLASGDLDRQIVIWDPITLKKINTLSGHRGAIRGLAFRKKTHTLYSCSDDRSLRIWSLDEMAYVETLFGHQDSVTCVDALTRDRAISCGGRDSSIRVWKIVEESQLVYNGHYNGTIDAVKLVNEENFISCGDDGILCTWNVNRKKPLFSQYNAHGVDNVLGKPNWISAISAWHNTDVVASGSCDGYIRLWKCGERFRNLTPVVELPCNGWINALEFSNGGEISDKFLVAGIGKEHKLGRWFENIKEAKNSIVIIPLSSRKPSNNLVPNGTEETSSSNESESESEEDANNQNETSKIPDLNHLSEEKD